MEQTIFDQLNRVRELEKESLQIIGDSTTSDAVLSSGNLQKRIGDLMAFSTVNEGGLVFAIVKSLSRVFATILQYQIEHENGKMALHFSVEEPSNKKNRIFREILIHYKAFVDLLNRLLMNEESEKAALDSLMEIIKKESQLKFKLGITFGSIDKEIFYQMINKLIAMDVDNDSGADLAFQELSIYFFEKYLHKYPDICFHTLSAIHSNLLPLDSSLKIEKKKKIIKNIYQILQQIKLPNKETKIELSFLFVSDGVSEEETIDEEKKEVEENKDNTLEDILFEGTSIYESEIKKDRKRKLELKNKKAAKQKKLKKARVCDFRSYQKVFSDAYLQFLKEELPLDIYKKLLFKIPDDVIPNLISPFLLHDFLIESYKKGGVFGILALNGLFVLITQHNLDYPNFFKDLYVLLEPSIYHMKYRSRFFYLLNIFLSSRHLPSHLVAAFIKKLSRMALQAPPSGCSITLVLIYNLLQIHPSCRNMIHKPSKEIPKQVLLVGITGNEEDKRGNIKEVDGYDVFDDNQEDPAKSCAIGSSLWELTALQNHNSAIVSKLAKIFEGDFTKQFLSLTDFLDESYQSMFDMEYSKKYKQIPFAFEKFNTLFGDNCLFKNQ